jgi:hypothetical protein
MQLQALRRQVQTTLPIHEVHRDLNDLHYMELSRASFRYKRKIKTMLYIVDSFQNSSPTLRFNTVSDTSHLGGIL